VRACVRACVRTMRALVGGGVGKKAHRGGRVEQGEEAVPCCTREGRG
jgi:hypothetical protein